MKTRLLARLGAVLISSLSLPLACFAVTPTLYFQTGFNTPAAPDSTTLMKDITGYDGVLGATKYRHL